MHFARHAARLRHGAGVLRIALPWTDEALHSAACAVAAFPEGVLRITLTRGPAPRGLLPRGVPAPTLLITGAPGLPALAPGRAIVAVATRRNEHSPLARIKSLNYLDSILARQEAEDAGADDAILRNTAGNLAEAAAGNLFVQLDGIWCTPPVADGALPGIARALILEAGLACERRLAPDCLARVTGAFVSSSLGLRPLAGVGERRVEVAKLRAFNEAVLF